MRDIVITCAVTGAGDTVGKHPAIPVTPQQIAEACIDAAKAGAAIVHVHVRDPETGQGARNTAYYEEVVARVQESGCDVVFNLTAGMGGIYHAPHDSPTEPGPLTDLIPAAERFVHIEKIRPDICTIDCGSMNFGADVVVMNRPADLAWMARRAQALGVKPELECFDMSQVWQALNLVEAGLVPDPPMFQFCLGIPGGAPASAEAMLGMRAMLPAGAHWAAFGISRHEFPMLALAAVLGGHVRVGLEDNLYLEKGVFASNGQLVEKAARILTDLGFGIAGPDRTRAMLGLGNAAST